MFDWLYSSAMFGVFIALFPIVYAVSKVIRQLNWSRRMCLKSRLGDSISTKILADDKAEKCEKQGRSSSSLIDDDDLLLMKDTVDEINYHLSLIESSIYKDLNPKPYLTTEEYKAAAQQMKDIVDHFTRMKKNSKSMPVECKPSS